MRRRIWLLIAGAILAFVSVAAVVQPASATIWYDQAWHSGRMEKDWYGAGSICTSGPKFYSWTNNRYMMAMPRHCFENNYNDGSFGSNYAPFTSRWEDSNNNKFDGYQIGFRTNALYAANIDAVIIDIGPATSVARSRYVFNYCNGGTSNCSSWMGGGDSNNVNWVGTWNRVVANGWPSTLSTYLCKAGLRSGTNCGYGTALATATTQGYSSPVMTAYGQFGDCMTAGGDSGAPIMMTTNYQNLGTDTTMAGMLIVGSGTPVQAGPGNDCYGPLGSPITYYFGFITEETIRAAFSAYNLQSVQWD